MPTPTDNNGPTFESWRNTWHWERPQPLSDAEREALYHTYFSHFPEAVGQDQVEGEDMRRKQSDGTWLEGGFVCLDRAANPITSGVCIYRDSHTQEWRIGRLLGVGKQGTWRVRDRFTRAVTSAPSTRLFCCETIRIHNKAVGRSRPLSLKSVGYYMRQQVGVYGTFVAAARKRFTRRANTYVPAVNRVTWLIKHFAEPFDAVLWVTVDGALLESHSGYIAIAPHLLADDAPESRNEYVQYYARHEDSRYSACLMCGSYGRTDRLSPVSWNEPGHAGRYTCLCGYCVDRLTGQGCFYNDHTGTEDRCTITRNATGYAVAITPARVRIAVPGAVQAYSTRVERALNWIGTGPFHLGMEIEGFTPVSAKLCQALYKAGLALGKQDSSIRPETGSVGVEVVTTPIAADPAVYRKAITKLARLLDTYQFDSNASCGGHVHITASAVPKGAIARLRYAIAKYPAGWSLIFGRDFNGYCQADGQYVRPNGRRGSTVAGSRSNILDALAIGARGAIVPNTGHGTHEFRAFASRFTLPLMLASYETVLAMRAWVLSMPSDYTLASYLKFMHASEGADTYSKRLAHERSKVKADPFDQIVETLTPKDAPELAYARAMAVSALVRIRMARVKANRPPSTPSKPKPAPAPACTLLDEAKKRVQDWCNGQIACSEVLYISPGPNWSTIYWRDHGALSPGLVVAAEFRDTRLSYGGVDLVIREQDREAWNAPFNGGSHPQTPAKNKNLPPEVLTLAI
jgi:hypothetical protein